MKQNEYIYADYLYQKSNTMSIMTDVHYHNHYEIYYLLSGHQKYYIDGSYYEVQKNNVVVIKHGLMHKTTLGFKGLRFIINFSDKFLKKYMSAYTIKLLLSFFDKIVISPDEEAAKKIINLSGKFEIAVKNSDDDAVFLLLMQLFSLLNDSPSAQSTLKKHETPILDSTVKYIQKNFDTITGLDEVANALFVSKYYICQLFSKHLQTTFNSYLIKIKLKNAEQQLINTTKSISEISADCGFNSTTYFCYVFKKNFGIPPFKYRTLLTAELPPQKEELEERVDKIKEETK